MPFLRLLIHIGKKEGWQRLYRGLPSAIVGSGLSWALYFGWHEGFKRWILSLKGQKRMAASDEMLAAAMAGILTTLIVNPIWVINTRMKVAAKKRAAAKAGGGDPNGNGHVAPNAGGEAGGNGHASAAGNSEEEVSTRAKTTSFTELIRKEGLMGWLTGIVPSLLLLINPAIQLLVYARLRRLLQKRMGRGPGPTEAALMGAVS